MPGEEATFGSSSAEGADGDTVTGSVAVEVPAIAEVGGFVETGTLLLVSSMICVGTLIKSPGPERGGNSFSGIAE